MAGARSAFRSLLCALGLLFLWRSAAASRAAQCIALATAITPTASWTAPLDRAVTLQAYDVSLREALDRLAAAGKVRLTYSAEALPLDRAVCVSLVSASLGDVLARLLDGTSVRPVVADSDHIVLAPVRPDLNPEASQPIVLDRIVVTGSASGAAARPLPVAIDVLDGADLEAGGAGTMSQALNGLVPGVWLWEQAPSNLVAGYGSIRGASSFGLSYPKVYIDGIEVANPLLLTRLPTDAIERIEVIRGPQGAALYGADAISGVTNIVTNLGTGASGGPRLRLESGFGLSASDYTASAALGQNYALTWRTGTSTDGAGLTVAAHGDGAFVPGAYAHSLDVDGGARSVGARSVLTGTLRFFGEQAASPVSPILAESLAASRFALGRLAATGTQSVVEYTAGTTFKWMPTERWTHTVVAGVDGYTLSGLPDDRTPIPAAADSALRAAEGAAVRGTLRLSSSRRIDVGDGGEADVALVAEQSLLRQATTTQTAPTGPSAADAALAGSGAVEWRSTTGVAAIASGTVLERFFLSGGLRIEGGTGANTTAIPMLGGAWTTGHGPVTIKLRAAYGSGARWPSTTPRQAFVEGVRPGTAITGLSPERQSGTEGGFDLLVARTLTLQVTGFDQTASGLIQWVSVPGDSEPGGGPGGGGAAGGNRAIAYQFQNVGEITNRGWELKGSLTRGGWALIGTMSIVDSRVARVASGYTGDLAAGDRMLQVPARTLSLTASWTGSHLTASVTAYRAEDWIYYDRLALARAFANDSNPARDLVGPALRRYWITYPGITHLRAAVTWSFRPRLGLTLIGDNLLDQQTGEPDNVTVLPGRTISVGLRVTP